MATGIQGFSKVGATYHSERSIVTEGDAESLNAELGIASPAKDAGSQ